MDGRKNNGGARAGSGHKGFGKMSVIQENYDKYSPVFWKKLGELMEQGDKWALSEFNKIQVKMIPQKLTGDDDNPVPILVKFIDENNKNTS